MGVTSLEASSPIIINRSQKGSDKNLICGTINSAKLVGNRIEPTNSVRGIDKINVMGLANSFGLKITTVKKKIIKSFVLILQSFCEMIKLQTQLSCREIETQNVHSIKSRVQPLSKQF
jgi:hypothetical protein